MLKRLKNQIPTIISLISTVILLAVALTWFKARSDSRVSEINNSYLIESTKLLASVFDEKLDDRFVMLESEARYFESVDVSDFEVMKERLSHSRGLMSFKNIGAANASGAAADYSGRSMDGFLPEELFNTVMRGDHAISSEPVTDEDGEKVLIAATPIKQKGRPVGLIFGTFSKYELTSLINISNFSEKGFNLLLDYAGNIIASSDSFNSDKYRITNLFTDTDAEKPAKNQHNITQCKVGGTESITVVTSIGEYDWYFVSVVPRSVMNDQTAQFSRDVVLIIIIVVFTFIILFISIMYLLKSNSDIIRSNERFKLVTVESQDMVFDYNYQKQQLILDGNIDNITADNKNEFSRTETFAFIDLIHDEDKDIKSRILDISNNSDTSVKGEFRLKCMDGYYCWFRIKATVVRGHDGHPQRMIGSIINVDEQMNRDHRLIEKAETDALTGIYNKNTFYERVNEKLKSASDSDLFAIYIIDLDNFKNVNDTLGHAMGDQVLSDVAKKLCIVFSDMDYVGRVGGDEFAAFLHLSSKARNVGMNIIEGKAKGICTQVMDTYSAKKKQVAVTASVGVAIYPYSGRDYNTLFRRADKALDNVKKSGKNSYSIYSPQDHDKPRKEL